MGQPMGANKATHTQPMYGLRVMGMGHILAWVAWVAWVTMGFITHSHYTTQKQQHALLLHYSKELPPIIKVCILLLITFFKLRHILNVIILDKIQQASGPKANDSSGTLN